MMFIFREEQYRDDEGQTSQEDEGVAEIIIGKQRNGRPATSSWRSSKSYTRFENLAQGGDVIRPTVARVDLAAIQANLPLAIVRGRLPRRAPARLDSASARPRIIAVVKANAYGHGAPQVGARARSAQAPRCWPALTSRKASCCDRRPRRCRFSSSARWASATSTACSSTG